MTKITRAKLRELHKQGRVSTACPHGLANGTCDTCIEEVGALVCGSASKFKNRPVFYEGKRFASKWEGERYLILRDREKRGEIRNLETQVRYELRVNGVHICDYIADFRYIERIETENEISERMVVEDAKGKETRLFKAKDKLMLALYRIKLHKPKRAEPEPDKGDYPAVVGASVCHKCGAVQGGSDE